MMYCTGGSQESSSNDVNFSYPNHNHLQQQQQSPGSGLMRYRSAPSSFFANLLNGGSSVDGCDDFQYFRPSNSEFDNAYGRLMSHDLHSIDEKLKHQALESVSEHNNGSYYNSSSLHGMQNHTDSSLGFVNSMGLENSLQIKVENGDSLNFGKQSSSPAGLLSNSAIENGFAAIRETPNFSSCNGTNGGEASRSTSRLKNHKKFSSGPSSSSRLMPQSAKIGNESFGMSSPENGNLQNGNGDIDSYMPTFTIDSWDDPAFGGLKRTRDGNAEMFFGSQNGDEGNHAFGLTRHMSLPSSSTEMAAIAKFRAKRGFATHPRSIAERVRRSRISERMKKLQELFPDMDKQTNTADMLDLAVDYIKNLQKHVKTLADTKSNCTCSSKQKRFSNATA